MKNKTDEYTIRKQFKAALKSVENSIKAGFNPETKLWNPHASLEGGTPTLAYGYKLSKQELKDGIIVLPDGSMLKFVEGLTEKEADILFEAAMERAEAQVEREWNSVFKDKWVTLDLRYRLAMVNIAFNIGSLARNGKWRWPGLASGILNKDNKEVRKQMLTSYYNPAEKKRLPLKKRRDQIADALEIV